MPNSASPSLFHSLTGDEVVSLLKTSRENGLHSQEITARLTKFGPNVLPQAQRVSTLHIFLNQFKSTIVFILGLASLISMSHGQMLDAYIILSLIVLNTIVGFVQEFQAEKSIEALKQLMVPQTRVRRNGIDQLISSHELIPGDIIFGDEGDHIPADARLLYANSLQVNESALTGESLPVVKQTDAVSETAALAERSSMIYFGTTVLVGSYEAVVVHTGVQTKLGGIAKHLTSIEESQDHFKQKTDELAKHMGLIAIGSTSLIFLVGLIFRHYPFNEIFTFSLAALVSAMPEGLPVILTLILALSAKRLAAKKAIVRRLSVTETLAVVTTIVTDKTGTLTQNKMTVAMIGLPYQPPILTHDQTDKQSFIQADTKTTIHHLPLNRLLTIAGSCHGVRRELNADGSRTFSGDPTEVALVQLADSAKAAQTFLSKPLKQLKDLPFNQEHRWRASLIQLEKNDVWAEVIGSPETVIGQCAQILLPDHQIHAINESRYQEIMTQVEAFTQKGMRVLALAYKPVGVDEEFSHDSIHNMIFVGVVGILDPLRPESKRAVKTATAAGIRVIMATGDHPLTARAIGQELDLIDPNVSGVITEADFRNLTDAEVIDALTQVRVFARMTPDSKLRLAQILQSQGEVIAMTGDGVNDAPALKQADIGISMGKNGTDVAREASDIILSDDNFATILKAIEEGRTQLRNVRRTSFFYITTNLAETVTLLCFLVLGLPMPLLPKQILWLNLVTGGITDIALATEPMHDDVLKAKPRSKTEPILNRQLLPYLAMVIIVIVILGLGFFQLFAYQGLTKARTILFVILSASQIYNLYNMRSIKRSVFTVGIFSSKTVTFSVAISLLLLIAVVSVPFLARVFVFQPLLWWEMLLCLGAPLTVVLASEVYKVVRQHHHDWA